MARSQEYAFPSQYPDTVTHYSQRFWNAKSAMAGYRQQMSTQVKYTASLQLAFHNISSKRYWLISHKLISL